MTYALKVKPGTKVKLADYPTDSTGGLTKEEGQQRLIPLAKEIGELQELLYAATGNSLLIILQGMDTSGKDGTISSVLSAVDPLGCRVWPFKTPTLLELQHDFLWRVHKKVPELGMMTVFNRSHYEDVLIVRVKNLVPRSVWSKRYGQINDFESLLAESNTIVLKFFLHISQEEQKERLLAREAKPEKSWKLSAGDWIERNNWDAYQVAYEAALTRCSTNDAPWYVIPADRKWFRDLAVAETIAKTLRPYKDEWINALKQLGERQRAEIELIRKQQAASGKSKGSSSAS